MKPSKYLLLVNTGTPDSPDLKDVRKYLSEFLNDPDVIDLPFLARKILVNLIIIPFRVKKSSKLYSELWTDKGSPLRINLVNLTKKLNSRLNPEYHVLGAMRYGNPSTVSALKTIPKGSHVTVIPLFPQYASATTGSVIKAVKMATASSGFAGIQFIDQFCCHPAFIDLFSGRIRMYNPEKYDHIIFSYHSLPIGQIAGLHKEVEPESCECTSHLPDHGSKCYKAMCFQTTRLIAGKLNLADSFITTAFQSQMSKKWIGPFTGDVIRDLALKGSKRILVTAPSFVSDCLETITEIKGEYSEIFRSAGGSGLTLVESLNYGDDWVDALAQIVETPGLHCPSV